MGLLSNVKQLAEIQDRDFQDIEVPEWGAAVRLAVMTGIDRDSWEMSMMKADNSERGFGINLQAYSRANMVARCIVDEDFKRIFKTQKDIEVLSQKSSFVLDRLFDICQEMNGITDDDIDELEKNSEAAQSGDSGSN